MVTTHNLKLLTPIFEEVKSGDKELKLKNDREFKVGDTLIIDEMNIKGKHTGAWAPKAITYMNTDEIGYVTLGTKDIKF